MSNNENNSLNFSSFDGENIEDIMEKKDGAPISTKKNIGILKNKKSLIFTVCVTLTVALLLVFTLLMINKANSDDGSKKDKVIYTTDNFEYKTNLSDEVKGALNTTDKAYLVLVNKSNPLGEAYVPSNLKRLDSSICTKDSELQGAAAIAADALVREMWACGFADIRVTSAYRSYARQNQLFESYISNEIEKKPSLSRDEAKKVVLGYSAEAGYSEHQSGLCVDLINTKKMAGLYNYGSETTNTPYDLGFAEIPEYEWLLENAHKFGFILRYPDDKTNVTGYEYESWHYRFVGVDAATKIYNEGITLEEYLK